MKFETQLVQFDAAPGDPARPTATPIYQTATFEQESATGFGAYDYSRSGNPTRTVLERQLARLERGAAGFAFASGMAALTAETRLLEVGDTIVADRDLYGGTYRLLTKLSPRCGLQSVFADATDINAFRRALTPGTKLVHVETPTNPYLRVLDLRAIADAAHEAGALLSVDNTMLSPYLQNPLELGADIVIHSGTKYLSGHGDVTAGVVVVKDADLAKRIAFIQNAEGTALAPQECFLLIRGMKTLAVRLERQQQTAQRVAERLVSVRGVRRVYFPGLADHPGASVHKSQSRGPGAVISIEVDSPEAAKRFVESCELFATTVSFGSVASTISIPACMSHASVPAEHRRTSDVQPTLVRLSIGLEDPDDLIEDLSRALAASSVEVRVGRCCGVGASDGVV